MVDGLGIIRKAWYWYTTTSF